MEGNVKYYYGKRYERDLVNDEKAIVIHGTKCCVCGFDFEEIYGQIGKGYIEIHHSEIVTLENMKANSTTTDFEVGLTKEEEEEVNKVIWEDNK